MRKGILLIMWLSMGAAMAGGSMLWAKEKDKVAEERCPLVIRKYEVVRRKPELRIEEVLRYDADTNIVEQWDYQVLDIFDEEEWGYREVKYLTQHVISEYDEMGCYHRLEYNRDELDRHADDPYEDADTSFYCTEYFYTKTADGLNRNFCITAEDSIVETFDAQCNLLSSQTYLRTNGLLYERVEVEWSADSLEAHYTRYVYYPFITEPEMAPNLSEIYHSREVYNKAGDMTLYEDETKRQTIRYWYRPNGDIRKSYMRNYALRNGKWKCTDYSWIYANYRHGYTEVDGLRVGAAISIRDKYNQYGDMLSSYEVIGVACLIPFTNKTVYEYEYAP